MSNKELQDRLAAAQQEIETVKQMLKEKEGLKPWISETKGAFRRRYSIPGFYEVMSDGSGGYPESGYSKTAEQAEKRAHLDKVNDLLWGLKMTLEPDWEKKVGEEGYYLSYDYIITKWASYSSRNYHDLSIIYFSSLSAEEVKKYLQQHYPDGPGSI